MRSHLTKTRAWLTPVVLGVVVVVLAVGLLIVGSLDEGIPDVTSPLTARPTESTIETGSELPEVRYDDSGCTYYGPEPLTSPNSNLVRLFFRNSGDQPVLFVVLAVADSGRITELYEVEERLELSSLPTWVDIVERRTVSPGEASMSLFDVENGPHVFLCLEDLGDLTDLVDFVVAA